MGKQTVSIIMPTYNRQKTIIASLKSIMEQTYTDWELLIIDDGSKDQTEAVVQRFITEQAIAQKVSYHKLLQNSGANHARNVGVKLATGKYLAFQDSDDKWLPDKLAKQVAILEEEPTAAICLCQMATYENDKLIAKTPVDEFSAVDVTLSNLLQINFASTQTIVGTSSCFKNNLFDESLPRLQDWDLMLRLIQKYPIVYCPEVLIEQFISADSITKNVSQGIRAFSLILDKYSELYAKNKFAKYNVKVVRAEFKLQQGRSLLKLAEFYYNRLLRKFYKLTSQ
ncbi:glycosyltransferase family 2 protein [Liquorilactobacillus satsumensis]|uniref:Glycosyltransferase 2-like domain-containing protein n=1 Tax=Liquorilactobacillus satsumensis DSM 16230 = JCM 12392 TaxID=1423801 RepID=A0A0R1UYV5_9LACO|nr:glycosyltransferase family 2 protein [Liquorilactobacillus satsumensis]KRL98481.1 hypothetical protein FD50_GL000795 [Liquorilactobacillus satsumensis DSM 16230 = JCM 12392]